MAWEQLCTCPSHMQGTLPSTQPGLEDGRAVSPLAPGSSVTPSYSAKAGGHRRAPVVIPVAQLRLEGHGEAHSVPLWQGRQPGSTAGG